VPATEKSLSVSEQNPNETAISAEECSASGVASKASQRSVKLSTEAPASSEVVAANEEYQIVTKADLSISQIAEVINFLQSEYDVALTEEEDEGDVTATKPKSPWSKLKGFFKTNKSKKMKK